VTDELKHRMLLASLSFNSNKLNYACDSPLNELFLLVTGCSMKLPLGQTYRSQGKIQRCPLVDLRCVSPTSSPLLGWRALTSSKLWLLGYRNIMKSCLLHCNSKRFWCACMPHGRILFVASVTTLFTYAFWVVLRRPSWQPQWPCDTSTMSSVHLTLDFDCSLNQDIIWDLVVLNCRRL